MSNHKTICLAIRDDGRPLDTDVEFARRFNEGVENFFRLREKQGILTKRRDKMFGWILGCDTAEAQQVYVLQEGHGERVTATEGSKAAVDALVNVLRSRGYTCIKRSDNA